MYVVLVAEALRGVLPANSSARARLPAECELLTLSPDPVACAQMAVRELYRDRYRMPEEDRGVVFTTSITSQSIAPKDTSFP